MVYFTVIIKVEVTGTMDFSNSEMHYHKHQYFLSQIYITKFKANLKTSFLGVWLISI